jgi:hypothetical protein
VRRIVWITVTGNLFFVTRALLETALAVRLAVYWRMNGDVAETFSHATWDVFVMLKHWSESAILALMLYILQSRSANGIEGGERGGGGVCGGENNGGYQAIPETDCLDDDDANDPPPKKLSV